MVPLFTSLVCFYFSKSWFKWIKTRKILKFQWSTLRWLQNFSLLKLKRKETHSIIKLFRHTNAIHLIVEILLKVSTSSYAHCVFCLFQFICLFDWFYFVPIQFVFKFCSFFPSLDWFALNVWPAKYHTCGMKYCNTNKYISNYYYSYPAVDVLNWFATKTTKTIKLYSQTIIRRNCFKNRSDSKWERQRNILNELFLNPNFKQSTKCYLNKIKKESNIPFYPFISMFATNLF